MQSLYELLKASKGLPVSDSYAALWGKSAAESGIKTLTGRLPLFFKMTETKLRDWVIFGNNEPGKNLISVEDPTGQNPGVTITRQDEQTGSIEAAVTSGRRFAHIYWYPDFFEEGQTYILSCYVNEVNEHARLCFRRRDGSQIIAGPRFTSIGYKTARITYTSESYPGGVYVSLLLNDGEATAGEVNISELMLRQADTSETFEPYQIGVGEKTENGYVLNIGVGFAPISSADPAVALIARKTINIGESPLTEGQTLSMSEFGDIDTQPYADIYIAAFKGFRYDDQLSSNQPRMKIKYKEYKE